MAQFKYMNEMNSLLNIDGPITQGPLPRWQKKRTENSSNNTNASLNSSKAISNTSSLNSSVKTPQKGKGSDIIKKKTPSKTPSKSKSPGRTATSASKNGVKTPGADRFIPSRTATNFEIANFKLHQPPDMDIPSPKKEMQRLIAENIHGTDVSKQKIFGYMTKPPAPPEGFQNPMRVLYTQIKTPASVKASSRYIPQAPDRILDAPDITDDYYLNLIDWSGNNILAVALGPNVYLWNAETGNIDQIPEMEGTDYVCSVSWIQEGDYLAIGTTTGTVELWDCSKLKRLRIMEGHAARVGSLSWNSYVLSSGCRAGQIVHHDVRQREHLISTINAHTQEVCGLKWSPDGKYLASGGNDNVLNIWQAVSGSHHTQTSPIYNFMSHQAAVKAIAWCPWKPNILASGGGTADRCIKIWNVNTGACMNSIDTKSQVCSLLWSSTYSEIVSGHGFANNQLIIWKYPMMNKVAELTGHTARVLHLAMSPDGTTVLSAGADETLRLWKCFTPDPAKIKKPSQTTTKKSIFTRSIR